MVSGSRYGPLTRGDLSIIEPGCEVWARTDGDLTNVRMTADSEARGGIVLEVIDTIHVDDNGEITPVRAFRCADYTRPRFTDPRRLAILLTEAMVDPDSLMPPDTGHIRLLARRLAGWVAFKSNGPSIVSAKERSGTMEPAELDALRDAALLARIVVGGA